MGGCNWAPCWVLGRGGDLQELRMILLMLCVSYSVKTQSDFSLRETPRVVEIFWVPSSAPSGGAVSSHLQDNWVLVRMRAMGSQSGVSCPSFVSLAMSQHVLFLPASQSASLSYADSNLISTPICRTPTSPRGCCIFSCLLRPWACCFSQYNHPVQVGPCRLMLATFWRLLLP